MNWHPDRLPVRSLLFVPGNNPKMTRKAWSTAADAVILDLEDAIPPSAKNEARVHVQSSLAEAPQKKPYVFVRINSFSTPYWKDDLKAVASPNIHSVVLPKCDSPEAVRSMDRFLQRRERIAGLNPGTVVFFLLIESAKGLLNMGPMLKSSTRILGLILGGEDFCLEMGISRTLDGTELLFARSSLSVYARAHGCYAIDTIYDNCQDSDGLLREAKLCKALGFSGKLAIHPNQIGPINSVFLPSAQEVSEAKRILDAFTEAQSAGKGVTAIDGKMIDRPIVERARRIVAMASGASGQRNTHRNADLERNFTFEPE